MSHAVTETAPTQTAPEDEARASGLTLAGLWAFVAVALPAVASLKAALSSIDLAYQIRAGELMLSTGHLIRSDSFTFTAVGRPWLDQQWGAQILFALMHRAGGFEGLAILRAAIAGAIFFLVYRACRAAGASAKPAAWLTIASFVAALAGLSLRPQLLGMLLFATVVWLVADRRRRPRRLWAIPALVVAWANLHGSFFLAPLLLVMAWLEDRNRRSPDAPRTLSVALAAAAAATLNPFGLRIFAYAVDISTNPLITRNIQEWAPPTIKEFTGAAFFASAAAVAAFLALRARPAPWPMLVALGVFFAIGLDAGRGDFWWAIAVPPIVAAMLPEAAPRERRRRRPRRPEPPGWVNAAIASILIVLGASFLPGVRDHNPLVDVPSLLTDAPTGVTAALARTLRPGDRVFAPQRWGSWFELALPDDPVFVDSRIEVFSESIWRQYQEVSFGLEGWQDVLDRWHVAAVVINPEQQAHLLPRIERDPGWRLAYRDTEGSVFVRA